MDNRTIAIFAPHFEFSGTTDVMITLAREISTLGYEVHLVRAYNEWSFARSNSADISVINLACTRLSKLIGKPKSFRVRMALLSLVVIPSLVSYLRNYQPKAIIMGLLTVPGLWACRAANVTTKSIVSVQGLPRPHRLHHPIIQRYSYLMADAIVADCAGVAEVLTNVSGISRSHIQVVHNPVLDGSEISRMQEPVTHPWFSDSDTPIILGLGRLLEQKDFPTLLRAFAIVRSHRRSRLLILGEGKDRKLLETMTQQLGISKDVSMPGHVNNPFSYMAKADMFVLSSLWEGPGHVVIEALSTGTPIISTDCPAGPRETLLDGRLGSLVPVSDPLAMAEAIIFNLDNPGLARAKAQEGLKHLDRFRSNLVAQKYLNIIEQL